MQAGTQAAGQWPEVARQWRRLGTPLRPHAQDVAFFAAAAQEWIGAHGTPRVLLLGVTPELHGLPWPAGTDLLAIDRTPAMIEHVWPGRPEAARCADWRDPDLPARSRDIALCDGGLHLLDYPEGQSRLVRMLQRTLAPGGLFLMRLYVPPLRREEPAGVLAELEAGRISSLNILKLRLGMALMDDVEEGIELDRVWNELQRVAPDVEAFASSIGWDPDHALAIHAYRGNRARYHFSTVEQVRALFTVSPGGFDEVRMEVPTYELGAQCPTLVLRRRAS